MGDEGHDDPVAFVVSGIFDVGAAENTASDDSISFVACISISISVVPTTVTAIGVSISVVAPCVAPCIAIRIAIGAATALVAIAVTSVSIVARCITICIAVGAAAARIPTRTINKHIAQSCGSDDRTANFGRDNVGVSRGGQHERGLRVLEVCDEDGEAGELLDRSLGRHIQRVRSLFDARRVVCRGRCRGRGGDGPQEGGHRGLGCD